MYQVFQLPAESRYLTGRSPNLLEQVNKRINARMLFGVWYSVFGIRRVRCVGDTYSV